VEGCGVTPWSGVEWSADSRRDMTHARPFYFYDSTTRVCLHEMTTNITVGVLALQGAFSEHIKLLHQASEHLLLQENLEWNFIEVRTPGELAICDALIIPGGESTTVSLVAARSNLLDPLRDFVKYSLYFCELCSDRG